MARDKEGRRPGERHLGAVSDDGKLPFEVPGNIPLLNQPKPQVLLTTHSTTFQGCNIDLAAIVTEDMEVTGYQISILDPHERHAYLFRFGQELLEVLRGKLFEVPNIGEKVPDPEEDTPGPKETG